MAFSVQMPALGESVTEGTVTRWLKQEGDRVEVDEPLLEVSTDKVDTEIPSPAAGVLQRIVAGEDETVEVGGELAVIGDGDDSGSDDSGSDDSDGQSSSDDGGDTPAESAVEAPAEEEPVDDEPASPPNQAEEPAEKPQASTKPSGSGGGTAITMPELGESVTEGTVTRWLKEVGDEVAVDEPLLEVSTDKVDTEIPSPIAGTLLEITAAEDETVEVGGQLALIGDASEAPAEEPAAEPEPEEPKKEQPEQEQREEPEPADAPKAEAPKSGTDGGTAQVEEKAEREEVASELPSRPDSGSSSGGGSSSNGTGDAPTGAPYVTPLVRKLAAEHDVDLSTITGSGVGGRIRKQDVLAAAEAAAPEPEPAAPAAASPAAAPSSGGAPNAPTTVPKAAANAPEPGTTVKLPRLRQVIAKRMSESLAVSAQLTTVQQVDVTRIARLRAKAKAEFERREGVKLTYLPFFAKATVEALKAFPQVNASISEDGKEVTYHGGVHLAIAVDTPRGLLVPVIKNAEDLNLAGLARKIADVAARTRDNKIGPDELSGGTFTITNIGSAGALFDTPIINQPQVAILGTGVITKQPMVITGTDGDDVIAVRSVCYLPMTYDHRLVDGADAGRFVSAIKARLEEGAFEADLGL
ncbi:2-oxoglutarate dehydrogenase, E2 component, dihydrolipoamide succinyltransferase [Pseudonocardia sp. KRD-184]|uniref:Dihydrolipoamide acetyltransferase component of pyruvate dehydrogenase complex n=1 Tax=Pseudonocardia oceani TaxID=2792013 RepID=A0ABS6U3N5_9PSEU|nr:2-oxoglutarate dehydrogenase, E2 component, dihydrolipoamide succinyltransferase [Pseudonocardia oceani]MBW0091234.1 2-oxoglutarate dehydrogenase, E2 component, dihydrolipoamide succinyltransferase [Pseudonocardia oceani]MBW0097526.1 2-oxoglutarate dehydrogenase, E2 component, dihydrolipoamide succinyltransferase [Pseudonocardia oceani]MBW0110721.1 2-oxoglutarate dehydrogenase, E2 component, dihydrolipoamide succinyltransferase [Pseudonocardia oceani]MBW0124787.1 2-oxoglutarate dehydrogenase